MSGKVKTRVNALDMENVVMHINSEQLLRCKLCSKTYRREKNLNTHIKSHEVNDHALKIRNASNLDKLRLHKCNLCEKGFTAKKNLLKHLRVIHKNLNEAEKLQVKKTRCPEINCLFACRKMRDLRNHIEKHHEIKILKDVLEFSNEPGFLKWKKAEEDNSIASFVSFRKKGILRNGMVKKVLLCHRTGYYNPKGTGKHRLKLHGSCKIGGTCPAAMEMIQSPDGRIIVYYYKTHLGHSHDLVHLQLSREEKVKLSEKIKQGFSLDAILEDVKESIDPEIGKTKRIHILSKKDLYNIKQSSGVNKNKRNVRSYERVIKTTRSNEISQKFIEGPIKGANEKSVADGKGSDVCAKVNQDQNPNFRIPQYKIIAQNTDSDQRFCKSKSQVLLVSPNIDCGSITEMIFLQSPGESAIAYAPTEDSASRKRLKQEKPLKNLNSSSKSLLTLKLREKLDKIVNYLPISEYLAPKQFEVVDRKLSSIIAMYESVNFRIKGKKSKSRRTGTKSSCNNSDGIEPFVSASQSVHQSLYDSPLYAYFCNYS